MDFKIFDGNSDALREIIYARGWEGRGSFSLDITEGPLLSYFLKHFHDMGEFHVGCSADDRPLNFNFSYHWPLELPSPLKGEQSIVYERWLFNSVCWKNKWFHDKNGRRDLERVAKAFSNQENYEEELITGFSIDKKVSAGVSYGGTNQYLSLKFHKGRFVSLDGLYKINKKERTKLWFDKSYSPYELDDFVRPGGGLDLKHVSYPKIPEFGYEFLELGVTPSDLVGELFYVIFTHREKDSIIIKFYNFEEEKSFRDTFLANVPIADREWLIKEGIIHS